MLEIAVYSNDSLFLAELPRALSPRLGDAFRISRRSLIQTSLYDELEVPPDLCLVDLRDDPDRNLDFVETLRRGAGTEVMVVAPGPDWAMAAYNRDVLSYFLDPPDLERISELILRRFAQKVPAQGVQFSFRTTAGVQMLAAERIVYVEYSDHRLLIHTDTGRQIATTTMRTSFGQAAAQLLSDPRFVRTHASFLVNITHVVQFERYTLTMDTGAAVPVSHAKKPEVKRQFSAFFGS